MSSEGYNKISGRKTLILVILIMTAIIFLSVYSIYLMLRKSSVVTNSSYFEKPATIEGQNPTTPPTPGSLERFGD